MADGITRFTKPADWPEFLTPTEVAVVLDLRKSHVYQMLASGVIAGQRFGKIIRVHKSILEAYVGGTR